MAQGDLQRLIERAKQMMKADPEWYNTLGTAEGDLAQASGILARLELTSRWTGPNKATEIKVNTDRPLGEVSKAQLEKFINETDWANQAGSDSPVEAIEADLARAVIESGGTSTKRKKADRTSNTAKATLTRKELGSRSNALDLSVLALINARLPPAVAENMKEPRLNYQTGRFANSVRVTGIEQTPKGYPRLVYTYQRSPYDVFDPVLGKLPWKTPGRDPKTLIEKSIRDVAREMAIGRFYVRRA